MNDDERESLPVGVVTMLLTGYAKTIKCLWLIILAQTLALVLTVAGFLYYLSQYEINVTSYGDVESPHINSSSGQQADTLNNYWNGVEKDESKK